MGSNRGFTKPRFDPIFRPHFSLAALSVALVFPRAFVDEFNFTVHEGDNFEQFTRIAIVDPHGVVFLHGARLTADLHDIWFGHTPLDELGAAAKGSAGKR